ncbi:hypothetical protein DV738_g1448, partial [Chaetothyriales sp. CBS 135597]
MTSNLFSRWSQPNDAAGSIYQTIRQHDEDSADSDLEEQAGLHAVGGDGPSSFHDNPDRDRFASATDSPDYTRRPRQAGRPQERRAATATASVSSSPEAPRGQTHGRYKWQSAGRTLAVVDDAEDDVPPSLLIEGDKFGLPAGSVLLPPPPSVMSTSPQPRSGQNGPQHGQALPSAEQRRRPVQVRPPPGTAAFANIANADPREIASWRWANVINLDNFLADLYAYYLGSGFWSIILRRFLNLVTIAFLLTCTIIITQCIDYSSIQGSKKIDDVWVPKCTRRMGWLPNLLLWTAIFLWLCKAFEYVWDVRRLRNMHDFYLYLLNIPEAEVASISWQEIVSRLMALRDSNPTLASEGSSKSRRYAITQSKQRMDAHDIANRLMRKDNYMIALINKDILDMSLPIPWMRTRQFFTRTLEWNINWCVMDFVFNPKGQVRPLFLKDTHRRGLADALKRRFIFAGWANLIIAPFLIVFFVLQTFFLHFNEYQKNPSAIGSKTYNVLAEWKFREFNELEHLFRRRINMSQPFAARYVDQFPRDKTVQVARFFAFASGAVVSVLGVVALFDQENFLTFELTPGRTVLFWMGVAGGVWAMARGLMPDDNTVYEPAFAMQEVIDFTHYEPAHWKDRLHSVEVKKEFENLYQMKLIIFVEEVLSMIFTPFVLWMSLPKCSEKIIDFFREFTVHVDGIGYVCSFAEFKLRRPLEEQASARRPSSDPRGQYFASKDHKLEQSYWGFMNDYARNPKADVRLRPGTAQRRLNMPPPLPGLLSPPLPGAAFGPHNAMATGRRALGQSPSKTAQRIDASDLAGHGLVSPLQSLLLDPHHQPSPSDFGHQLQTSKVKNSQPSQHFQRRRTFDHPADVAEEDEPNDRPANGQPVASTGELGSWKYENEESTSSDEQDDEDAATEGVLGMIRQLQTQGEGNRTAQGI